MARQFLEEMVYPSVPLLRAVFAKIEDPRRIVRVAVVPAIERLGVHFTWLAPHVPLREKCALRGHLTPLTHNGCIPYIGVDSTRGKEWLVVQADPRVVRASTLAIALAGYGEGRAPVFHTIVREMGRWLRQRGVHDVYSFAPDIMQGARLATWSSIEEGILVSFPTVRGRAVQHVRVWPGEGILATDGGDTMQCVPNEVFLAAGADIALCDTLDVYRTEGPRIVFPTTVHPSGAGKEITLFLSSHETAYAVLSSVEDIRAAAAAIAVEA